jgi:hypothetical protein
MRYPLPVQQFACNIICVKIVLISDFMKSSSNYTNPVKLLKFINGLYMIKEKSTFVTNLFVFNF